MKHSVTFKQITALQILIYSTAEQQNQYNTLGAKEVQFFFSSETFFSAFCRREHVEIATFPINTSYMFLSFFQQQKNKQKQKTF